MLEDIGTVPASALPDARVNLNDDERLVRLGASRALVVLGPQAADAVPEMIQAALDFDRDSFGIGPLAASGVFDDRVKEAVRAFIRGYRFATNLVLHWFGKRAAFFEPEMRSQFLANPKCGDLYELAEVTNDQEGFADWLLSHESYFEKRDVLRALGSLDEVGLAPLLEKERKNARLAARYLESAARRLGAKALPPLLAELEKAKGEDRARVLSLLALAAPSEAALVFGEQLTSESAPVRATAALGLAAAYGVGTAPDAHVRVLLELTRDDDPAVRDGAWQALRAAGRPGDTLVAHVEDALSDESARVRVAAAEATLVLGGDPQKALTVLKAVLDVPSPHWGWIGGGGTPARTESGFDPTEELWARAARAIAPLGEQAAPVAATLVWAAIRHGEPRMQRILLGPIEAMGEAAEPVLPLLDRLAGHHGTWLGFHETVGELRDRLKTIYRRFDRPLPAPDDDWWLED